jgi:hypothetical protein
LGIGILSNTLSPPAIIPQIVRILGLEKEKSEISKKIDTMNKIYNKLIGKYQTYKGFNTIEIMRHGNYLKITQLPSAHPFILQNMMFYPIKGLSEKEMVFKSIIAPGQYFKIAFQEDDKGIHVDIERYRYHKKN